MVSVLCMFNITLRQKRNEKKIVSLCVVQMIFLIKKEFLRCSGTVRPSRAILLTEKIKTSQWRKLCGYIVVFFLLHSFR